MSDPALDELSRLLASIARQTHSDRLYGEMATRSGVRIRPYLFVVLFRIRNLQPVRITDVAEEMESDRSTVSRQVAELTALGCVARGPDPTDGRVVVLTLTPLGEDVIGQVYDAWLAVLDEMTGDWPVRERKQLLSLLRRLDRALTEHFTPTPRAITG